MERIAIMVDGGFYRKQANKLFGKDRSAQERADELFEYCLHHLEEEDRSGKTSKGAKKKYINHDLYRIFYYDCRPLKSGTVFNPITKKNDKVGSVSNATWSNDFIDALTRKRKVAIRLGELSKIQYVIRQSSVKGLIDGKSSQIHKIKKPGSKST